MSSASRMYTRDEDRAWDEHSFDDLPAPAAVPSPPEPDAPDEPQVLAAAEPEPATAAPAEQRDRFGDRVPGRARRIVRFRIPSFVSPDERKTGVSTRRLPRHGVVPAERISVLLSSPDGHGYVAAPLIGWADFGEIGRLPLVHHAGESRIATTIEAMTGYVHENTRGLRRRGRKPA